ncbi:MAG: hypothetical protein AB7O98_00725 [Hyphomonadaceae bacterium]
MRVRLSALREAAVRFGQSAATAARDPKKRERFWAASTFAIIFTVFAGGVDYVLSGGPEWNPGAAAAPYVPEVQRVVVAAQAAAEVELPAPVEPIVVHQIADYSFTTETLLGGPELALAADELLEVPTIRAIDISYTPGEPLDDPKPTKISLNVSAAAATW